MITARTVRQAEGLDPVRVLQRVLYRSAKQNRTRRFHVLFDKLARSDVMWKAWVDVATNQGAPGVDGVAIADIEAGGPEAVRAFLDGLAGALRTGSYRPKPLRRVRIPKPGRRGETRPLGIPTVADRVVMAATKSVLEPIFEADFHPVSFGFRPKRSATQALEAVRRAANGGRGWVLDADIKACFDVTVQGVATAGRAPTELLSSVEPRWAAMSSPRRAVGDPTRRPRRAFASSRCSCGWHRSSSL
ncbi:MAG: reverse transcriptase domain-containing protein, partial [Actinomycetota bacterium]|nr:reverse transcriptase domain-containing protein [Actinomycetota bacterium]